MEKINHIKICEKHNCEKVYVQRTSKNKNRKEWICNSCVSEKRKTHYNKNKDKILAKIKDYNINNREIKNKYANEYTASRRKRDPIFNIRLAISSSIHFKLKSNNKESCLKYLNYTIQELKNHLESLFSHPDNLDYNGNIWMTWQNHGPYKTKTWNDNDSSTWKWNIDHIIPHSDLPYTSMEDENFKICWSLDNLRPLSAKQNILDGTSRIRHKKV